MPTYVYRCKKGHTFELFHSISDDDPKRCPSCRSGAMRVPAGGSGVLFKGSGFYATDYRSKGYKESAKKEGSAGSAKPADTTGGSPSSSSDSSSSSGSSGSSGPGGSSGSTGSGGDAGGPTPRKPPGS